MEISYKRSMDCNYIILQEQETETRSTYQVRILLENQIAGLLPCKIQRVNGEDFFYYEITGCQNLVNLFEKRKFKETDLVELFTAVIKIIECLDEYLLKRDFLRLQPAYIYKNMESGSYIFLWFPFLEDSIEGEFRKLTEYLLPRIEHSDKKAVEIGYGIYKESMEESMQIELLKKRIYSDTEEASERTKSEAEVFYHSVDEETEQKRQQILDDFYKEEEEAESPYSVVEMVVIFVLLIGGFFLIRHLRLWNHWYFWLIMAIFTIGGAAIGGIRYVWKRKKEETKEHIFEENNYQEKGEAEEEVLPKGCEEEIGRTVLLQEEIEEEAYLMGTDKYSNRKYSLEKEINLIGKWKESVDICLEVPTVSRIHAKIVRREQGDYLVDLNSRNGTSLNGQYLDPEVEYFLEDNSEIVFAEVKFYYFAKR